VADGAVSDERATTLTSDEANERDLTSAPAQRWRPSGERTLLALLLVGAAVVRLLGPGQLEPNISSAEISHLASIEALLTGQDSSLVARTGLGASALALLPAAVLRLIRPEPELALRLCAALGSLGFVALFYLLCRTRFPPVVSLTTTALLAFSPWSIFFGRNGELNAFVGCWAVLAILALERALRVGSTRRWLLAGAAATAGLYWHPSAIWLLPALAIPVIWSAIDNPDVRPRLAIALGLFLVAGFVVAAPRVPGLVTGPIATSTMLAAEGAQPDSPTILRNRAQQAIRAFLLLDPTAVGDQRYQPPGQAPLDGLTGVLVLAGVVLAAWQLPSRVLPLALMVVPLAGSQLASPRVPSLADAVVALPGLYLLVAEALERLVAVLPFPSITRAAMLVAIPAYAMFGWGAYAGWIGSAASAQARQPAIDYDEVDAWIGEQRSRLAAGQAVATARQWRDEHPRLTTGSRVVRRPRDAGPASGGLLPARPDLRQVGTIPGEGGSRAARGVAANATGELFVADASGRVSRVDPERGALVPLQQRTPPMEQVSDVAADADGFLYLADAERSVLVKLRPTGEVVTTIGQEWAMYRPRGLTIGPDGRIYVADTGRNRIAVGTADGRFQKSIAPPASFGPFEQPTEVAVDPSGRIYVGLPEIGSLAILDESGQILGGWAIPKGNTIESSRFVVVADGVIAMTDPAQSKVRLLDADGRELAVSDAPGRPYGVALANAQLFVAEPSTGRVLVFSLGGP
jgi:sugar lactone lactonase YvrE